MLRSPLELQEHFVLMPIGEAHDLASMEGGIAAGPLTGPEEGGIVQVGTDEGRGLRSRQGHPARMVDATRGTAGAPRETAHRWIGPLDLQFIGGDTVEGEARAGAGLQAHGREA